MRILIVRFDGIGDAVTLVPLIAALREAGHELGIVLSDRNAGVFAAGIFLHRSIVPWRSWRRRAPIGQTFAGLLNTLRDARYDWALIPTEEPAAYALAKAAGVPNRRGFDGGWRKPLKTLWIRGQCTETIYRGASLQAEREHEVRVLFRLSSGLTTQTAPSRDSRKLAAFVLDGLPPNRTPEMAVQWTPKWNDVGVGHDTFDHLLGRLQANHQLRVLGAHSDDGARKIAALAAKRGVAVELFSVQAPWKAAIARARMLLTPDTGAAHIAGMVGTPVVDVFAATADYEHQVARWAPWAAPYELVLATPDQERLMLRVESAVQALADQDAGNAT